jgi:dienelactone hydrolase
MRHRGLGLAAAALAALPAFAQPVIDYAREQRWAEEVVPAVVVGDAVYLSTPGRARILALLAEPAGAPKGGVVVVHGLGVHPDFGMTGGVRTGLADAGFVTLSVQMPVLSANASRDDYRVTLPAAGERIAAAIAYLRAKGVAKVAIVAHSVGATMADAYLARADASRVDAWVPVGMLVDFTAAPKEPVLDVLAATEFPEVDAAAPARARRLPKDACSRQVVIPGTRHYFDTGQKELVAAIAAFLDRAFAGRC